MRKPSITKRQNGGDAETRATLTARMKGGLDAVVSRADRGADRLVAATRELGRSPALRHGLAARERGNLEAAFWLLAEEHRIRPDDPVTSGAYWEVALQLQRVDLAAPAGVALVEQYASAGEVELAAQYWLELVGSVPDTLVSPTALALILPVLSRRVAAAPDDARNDLLALARRAVRQAVDPRNQPLSPGVAMRLFEDGREINPEAARRAAQVALESPNLHEAKRARVEAWLAGGAAHGEATPPEQPEEMPSPPPCEAQSVLVKALDAVPVGLGGCELKVRLGDGRRGRVAYESIAAVSVAEVAGLATRPIRLIDLVLNQQSGGDKPLRVVRLRDDTFDPTQIGQGGALFAFLGEILERSHAVPLPDEEAALGLGLTSFASLEAYEHAMLECLSHGPTLASAAD